MTIAREGMVVGVLRNGEYGPSRDAADYLATIIFQAGYNVRHFDLKDLLRATLDCAVVFNVYYGDVGDGGLAAGILSEMQMPVVGNSQLSSSLMMNKVVAKMIIEQEGFRTPKYFHYGLGHPWRPMAEDVLRALHLPILAKPVNGAASENITLLVNELELVEFVSAHAELVRSGMFFFEEFVEGVELSGAFVRCRREELPVAEIRVFFEPFQSHSVKFGSNQKENVIPASVPLPVQQRVQAAVRDLVRAFSVSTFARMDCIYAGDSDNLYLLEMNANPGLLRSSLLPQMLASAGVSMEEFVRSAVEEALVAGVAKTRAPGLWSD